MTHLELHALGHVVAEVVPLLADLDPHDAVLVARQELGALKLRGAMFKSEKYVYLKTKGAGRLTIQLFKFSYSLR